MSELLPETGGRRLRILSVGLGWASTTGGHTVTRDLSIGLAQAGHDVRMWLPHQLPDPGVPGLRVHHPSDPGERPQPSQSRRSSWRPSAGCCSPRGGCRTRSTW